MRDERKPHPGPWRVMQVDSGIAAIVIAACFIVLGLVGMPPLAIFLIGAVVVGVAVAFLLRYASSRKH